MFDILGKILKMFLSAGKGLIRLLRGEVDFEFLKKYGGFIGAAFLAICTAKSLIELKKAKRRAGK